MGAIDYNGAGWHQRRDPRSSCFGTANQGPMCWKARRNQVRQKEPVTAVCSCTHLHSWQTQPGTLAEGVSTSREMANESVHGQTYRRNNRRHAENLRKRSVDRRSADLQLRDRVSNWRSLQLTVSAFCRTNRHTTRGLRSLFAGG